ncbi:MAG: thioredoxin family protein [Theionarchaea archaeon]|nr:thioredoxin family protein [Theionarchaea archaeon]
MKHVWFIISCILVVSLIGCISQEPSPSEEDNSQTESDTEPKTYMDLTDEEILELISQMSPVVLYFYSPTCSTCFAVKPHVEEMQKEYNLDIIWVSKQDNKAIFDLYHAEYYPALYVFMDSEVYMKFDENDPISRIYGQILDGTITGMHRLEYTVSDDQVTIFTDAVVPDTLYYVEINSQRVFVFISKTAKLFVFNGSEGCDSSWLFLKKDLIYNGQFSSQWDRDTLEMHSELCGNLVQVPYTVTGSSIVISLGSMG